MPVQLSDQLSEVRKWLKMKNRETPTDCASNSSITELSFDQIKNYSNSDKIAKEEIMLQCETDENVEPHKNIYKSKRPFLKKGSGLLKYNLKPEEYQHMIRDKYSNNIILEEQTMKKGNSNGNYNNSNGRKNQNKQKQNSRIFFNSNRLANNNENKQPPKIKILKRDVQQTKLNNETNRPKSAGSDKNFCKTENNVVRKYSDCDIKKAEPNNVEQRSVIKILQRPKTTESFYKCKDNDLPVEFSPLKVPEVTIKPKGSWCNIFDNRPNITSSPLTLYSNDEKFTDVSAKPSWANNIETNSNINEVLSKENNARKSLQFEQQNEVSLYDTELRIFEALEKKTEQSGFCSTNTSILQLFSSPSRRIQHGNAYENSSDIAETDDKQSSDNESEILEMTKKNSVENMDRAEVLRQIQLAFKWENAMMENQVTQDKTKHDDEYDKHMIEDYADDESKTISCKLLSSSRESSIIFNEKNETQLTDMCKNCDYLIKKKLEECENELQSLKIEKDRVIAISNLFQIERNDFECKIKDFEVDLKHFEIKETEFDVEKKLFEMEKKNFEDGIRTQSTENVKPKSQAKKVDAEALNLKIELNNLKEQYKLRETKNATTLARLRNQLSQLDKMNGQLKTDNEKLKKENAKLLTQVKNSNKANDTKILKEIRKDLIKLKLETGKNQSTQNEQRLNQEKRNTNDSTTLHNVSEMNQSKRNHQTESKQEIELIQRLDPNYGYVPINYQQQVPNQNIELIRYVDQNNIVTMNQIPAQNPNININVEEKFKVLLGPDNVKTQFRNENILRPNEWPGKFERTRDDGTKEIVFENGNVKLISKSGNIRYFYNALNVWHAVFPNGTEVLEMPNGDKKTMYRDGSSCYFYNGGIIEITYSNGVVEVVLPDGNKRLMKDRNDLIALRHNFLLPLQNDFENKKIYPDGTINVLHPDGTEELKFLYGRIIVRDKFGVITYDSGDIF